MAASRLPVKLEKVRGELDSFAYHETLINKAKKQLRTPTQEDNK
jgi:hypothetical protein